MRKILLENAGDFDFDSMSSITQYIPRTITTKIFCFSLVDPLDIKSPSYHTQRIQFFSTYEEKVIDEEGRQLSIDFSLSSFRHSRVSHATNFKFHKFFGELDSHEIESIRRREVRNVKPQRSSHSKDYSNCFDQLGESIFF